MLMVVDFHRPENVPTLRNGERMAGLAYVGLVSGTAAAWAHPEHTARPFGQRSLDSFARALRKLCLTSGYPLDDMPPVMQPHPTLDESHLALVRQRLAQSQQETREDG